MIPQKSVCQDNSINFNDEDPAPPKSFFELFSVPVQDEQVFAPNQHLQELQVHQLMSHQIISKKEFQLITSKQDA